MATPDPLTNVNSKLNEIYGNLTSLQGAQLNAISNQSDLNDMVQQENNRLLGKQETIDQAVDNQKRIIYFNDNSRKISSAYITITIAIVATLGMIFLLRLIYSYFGSYLPDMLFNVLMAVIITGGLVMIYNTYKTIRSRDPYNFDELSLQSPAFGTPASTSSGSGDLSGQKSCIGSACCIDPTDTLPGSIWNSSLGKCIFAPPTGPSGTACPYVTNPLLPTATPTIQAFTLLRDADEPIETGYNLL